MKKAIIRFVVGRMLLSKNPVTRADGWKLAVDNGLGMELLKAWN